MESKKRGRRTLEEKLDQVMKKLSNRSVLRGEEAFFFEEERNELERKLRNRSRTPFRRGRKSYEEQIRDIDEKFNETNNDSDRDKLREIKAELEEKKRKMDLKKQRIRNFYFLLMVIYTD